MNRHAILTLIAIVIIVIVGIIGYSVWAQKSVTSSATPTTIPSPSFVTAGQTAGPDTAALSCYKTYIAYFGTNQQRTNSPEYVKFISQCFTDTYTNKWQGFVDSTEVDPVLLSQDFASSWVTNQHATVNTNDGSVSEVALTLGAGVESKLLTADLINVNGAWKIDSVHQSTDGK